MLTSYKICILLTTTKILVTPEPSECRQCLILEPSTNLAPRKLYQVVDTSDNLSDR